MFEVIKESLFPTGKTVALNDEIISEMKKQAIVLLALDHFEQDKKVELAPYLIRNYQLLYQQNKVVKLLEDNGIATVVLKGFAVGSYYPNPLYRISGDIDLWVDPNKFELARDLLIENGYSIDETEIEVNAIDKHLNFIINSIEIELHLYPVRTASFTGSQMEKEIIDYMSVGLYNPIKVEVDGNSFKTLAPLQNSIELLIHVQQHLRDGGIGLRQILDWQMFAYKEITDDKYEQFEEVFNRFGLLEFAIILTKMCQMHLGLSKTNYLWAGNGDESKCKQLMDMILDDGNFGRGSDKGRGTRFFERSLIRKLIYLQNGGEINYEHLIKKHHCVKYFAWLLQLTRYVKYTISNFSKIKDDYDIGKTRKNFIDSLNLFSLEKKEK